DADPASARRVLVDEIFARRGFGGDADHYDDPRNSFLDQVLVRRRGIPITLAIVYVATADRIGQRAVGVNAPGHFLIRHGDVLLDAFAGGREVSHEDFARRLRAAGVEDVAATASFLLAHPPTHREVLSRMLRNLKAIHLRRGEMERALSDVDRLVLLNPDQPHWLRDRAALYQRLGCTHAAIADLERFCERAPADPERDVVRRALVQLVRNAPAVH
ncbi:MAG: SirB1 family protein, partial [Alphaproteobacteria bacterium]